MIDDMTPCFGRYKSNCECIDCDIDRLRRCKKHSERIEELHMVLNDIDDKSIVLRHGIRHVNRKI